MDNISSRKCPNCGAGLIPANADTFQCSYCGNFLTLTLTPEEAYQPVSNAQNDAIVDTPESNEDLLNGADTEGSSTKGQAEGMLVALLLLAALVIMVVVIIANNRG
ncbi:hypothetical protein [Mucilaginibacter celer]|uniref:Zinc ribbon domain-containing protein n=1 Tax=Mucilaginibacter celer TaxID=2305508 RepID=A0A494VQM5_9SPHI|nr:hypothetical protein [Mucilaginibacter celer]AYL95570.1 hypothetical protein HYN43_009830 [Mucilaginibacter celer]